MAADSDSRPVTIRVEAVEHTFGGDDPAHHVRALDRISLEVFHGEMLCLIGPSGCGKSTLLNVIGGMFTPSSGRALIDGEPITRPMPAKIAYMFQESTLLPWATVLENIMVGLEFQGVAKPEREPRARVALATVNLQDFAAHFPDQLSGGMKQRVSLARALSLGTEILLMDEPFASLDEQTRMVFGEDLSQMLATTRKTIVFVTHSLAEAVFLADRVAVFTARPGSIKEIMTIDEPHPRGPDFMTTDRFARLRNSLYAQLRDEIRKAMREQQVPSTID